MNRLFGLIVLSAMLFIGFNSCVVEKDDEAKLQVTVEHSGQKLYDAMVRLYLSEDDFKAQGDNFVNGKATDLLGSALFTGLPEKQYYIGVTYSSLLSSYDNFTGIYKLDAPTQLGKTTFVTVDLDLSTNLELTIIDKQGNTIQGAIVKLFGSQNDAIDGTNMIGDALTTPSTGKVEFKHLFPQVYYFSVTKGDLRLYFLTNALTPNVSNDYAATLDPFAYLTVKVINKVTTDPVSSASVKLFTSEADWNASAPHYGTPLFTDNNGEAYFEELIPQEYWVEAIFGTLSNNSGEDASLGSFDAGMEYEVTVRISDSKADKAAKEVVDFASGPKFVAAKPIAE